MSKILAIDYGSKRVGVAITDSLKIIATGLSTVSTINIYSFLEEIIKKEKISHIVIGLPKNLDNSNTDSTYEISVFAVSTLGYTSLPATLALNATIPLPPDGILLTPGDFDMAAQPTYIRRKARMLADR